MKILTLAALVIGGVCLVTNVFAAGAYTITYVDANGTVLATDSANAGDVVNLPNYPSGAIGWVDNSANVSGISPSARGMAYVNYNLSNPAPATTQPFTMTMPANNVTLTAFYGDYQGGNEPRLFQFHLELKYHDVNSGCDLAFTQQYTNISVPASYVINLPGEDFFAPITLEATNCAAAGTYTSNLSIYRWVKDQSYTGQTVPPDNLLYDPDQMVYVDPNDYNEIYDVMVDPTLDWETGGDIQDPEITNPPVAGITSTVTFQIDPVVWTKQTGGVDSGQTAIGIGARFDYNFTGTNSTSGVNLPPAVLSDSTVLTGSAWGNWFGTNSAGSGNVPTAADIPGYVSWWTDQGGNIVLPSSIAANFGITQNLTYTLHYAEASQPPTPIVVSFNTSGYVYDSTERTVRGFAVTRIGATATNIVSAAPAGATSKVVDLQNGLWLVLAGRVIDADIDAVSGTAVGTYPLVASAGDFTVYNGNPASGGVLTTDYNVVVRAGGLTITPTDTNIVNPPVGPVNPGGGDGGRTPGAPNTGRLFSLSSSNAVILSLGIGLVLSVCAISLVRRTLKRF